MIRVLVGILGMTLLASSASSEHLLTYRISGACLDSIEVQESADLRSWGIFFSISASHSEIFTETTRKHIGSKIRITNGVGQDIGAPLATIQTPLPPQVLLAGYPSEGQAQSALESIVNGGGSCGPST